MGFFTPWFLAGLVGFGLPIWLHLLRQHKSEPQRFSSLMFFERRTQSSIVHRRLKYFLLFAARLALIFLVVLAFAEPFVKRDILPTGQGQKMLLVAVDRSFSMREGDRMSLAKSEAQSALGNLRAGDRGQVLAIGPGIELLSQPETDIAQLRAAVQSIQPADGRSSFAELAQAITSIAQSARSPLEVHLISDMQKTALSTSFSELRLPPDTKLVLHPVTTSRRPNWAVETVVAGRRVYDPKKFRIQATIAGHGTEAATRTVTLAVNGKTLHSKTVNVPANGRAQVEFLSLDTPYGLNRAELGIEPADTLPGDDRFRFAVERTDPLRVLFVHEARQQRGLLYFRSALESAAEAAFIVDAATSEQSGSSLSKYAFVVISDVASLPPGFEEALVQYVRGGGSVMICLGAAGAARPRVPVYDQAVIESRYATRSGDRFYSVDWLDTAHPSIRRANKWEGVKFYQVVRVEPGNGRVLARLADQTPVLLEKQIGEGRVVVFTSTLDNISNDFPLHAAFVPFIEQTARYLSRVEDSPPQVVVDSYLELRKEGQRAAAVEVLDPDGKRALSLNEAASAPTFKLAREGFYELRRTNGRHELVAVNADRRESDLDLIPKETLALWQNTGQAGPGGQSAGELATDRRPANLWWYVVLILFVVALAESLIASRYLNPAAPEDTARKEAA